MTELVQRDLSWARKITERLRLQATNYQEAREKVISTLTEARDGGAADLLGYASWPAYIADVFSEEPLRLEADLRKPIAKELSEEGMSTRAIGKVLGVTPMQVSRDIHSGVTNVTPEDWTPFKAPEGFKRVEVRREVIPSTPEDPGGEVSIYTELVPDVPSKITGLDGKHYTRPEPKKPQRRALTEVARDAGWDARKAIEKIERVWEDDRFSRNKEEVAELMRGHLMYVIETCQGFLDDINQSKENQS